MSTQERLDLASGGRPRSPFTCRDEGSILISTEQGIDSSIVRHVLLPLASTRLLVEVLASSHVGRGGRMWAGGESRLTLAALDLSRV